MPVPSMQSLGAEEAEVGSRPDQCLEEDCPRKSEGRHSYLRSIVAIIETWDVAVCE